MDVKIFRPSKTAMQSGRGRRDCWLLEYETGARDVEPLMGWTAAADTLNQVQLKFNSADQAIEFAKGKGWSYTVLSENKRRVKPQNYSDTLKYVPVED